MRRLFLPLGLILTATASTSALAGWTCKPDYPHIQPGQINLGTAHMAFGRCCVKKHDDYTADIWFGVNFKNKTPPVVTITKISSGSQNSIVIQHYYHNHVTILGSPPEDYCINWMAVGEIDNK
jgi:hypothetical protein